VCGAAISWDSHRLEQFSSLPPPPPVLYTQTLHILSLLVTHTHTHTHTHTSTAHRINKGFRFSKQLPDAAKPGLHGRITTEDLQKQDPKPVTQKELKN
jgi:hypothetical protein